MRRLGGKSVSSGREAELTLSLVPVSGGVAALGPWGSLRLTGAVSAVISGPETFDIELPDSLARALSDAALVLNDMKGVLLILPYADEVVCRVELGAAEEHLSLATLPRHADKGMRLAHLRFADDNGVLFMTERSLMFVNSELQVAWRQDELFEGWEFERLENGQVHLLTSDWSGHEERQVRSLTDGRRVG